MHSSDVNPCEYALAILKWKRLKDYDIIKSFGEMIQRKIKITAEEKQTPEWPYSPREIVEMLDKGPLPEIYNTVLYNVYCGPKGRQKLLSACVNIWTEAHKICKA